MRKSAFFVTVAAFAIGVAGHAAAENFTSEPIFYTDAVEPMQVEPMQVEYIETYSVDGGLYGETAILQDSAAYAVDGDVYQVIEEMPVTMIDDSGMIYESAEASMMTDTFAQPVEMTEIHDGIIYETVYETPLEGAVQTY